MSKIIDYELFEVPRRWLFLRLETSDGLVGWGEPDRRIKAIAPAIRDLLENHILGLEAPSIEDQWQVMYRSEMYRGGSVLMSAISAIDQALWDIKGKRLDVPVYELLGGRARERVRVYTWLGGDRETASDTAHEELKTTAQEALDQGYRSLVMKATAKTRLIDTPAMVETAASRLGTVREEVGQNVDIGINISGRLNRNMIKRLVHSIEPHDPMYIEGPRFPEDIHTLADIAAHTTIPIATGTRLPASNGFTRLLDSGCVDFVQPNLSIAGGPTQVKKVADAAEIYDTLLVPNCPVGPVGQAACLQIAVSSRNVVLQEQSHSNSEYIRDYISNREYFSLDNGYVQVPDTPGLGVEINEAVVRERSKQTIEHKSSAWRHEDGTVAER